MSFNEKESRKLRSKEAKNKKHEANDAIETSGDEKNGDKTVETTEHEEDSDCGALNNAFASTSASTQVGRKSLSGQTCSLKTLIDDQVLDAGEGMLMMEYMGAKFIADLLPNGTIRWVDTKQIFSTPSAWVNHCKKIVNPDNSGKTGSAWSTIRYKGKRLDSYKLRWYRKQKKIVSNCNLFESSLSFPKSMDIPTCNASLIREHLSSIQTIEEDVEKLRKRNIIEHKDLSNRSSIQDLNVMVKCTPFSALERIQPFTVTISTNALLLIDFHCHLTTGEVVGYLGGNWDITSHNLAILQAFPCRSRLADRERAALVEEEIRQNLEQRNMNVVGWYHSHPKAAPQPTVKDIESQMEYQIAMKGESDSSYIPCIGLICSPYDEWNKSPVSTYQSYWVMPPPEYRPQEYGKPMQMLHTVTRDSFLTQDLLLEMRLLAHFYIESRDAVDFKAIFKGDITYWEKLQISLQPNLPRDLQLTEGQTTAQAQVQQQALSHFWAFLKGLILV
ncbi:MPN domain-containing protein-like protein [Dinothrombium tinctorium]|uniref:MPN domain-containing protein-like protein n=1 Tax=Dinothrombium tinctorium TaxID=1965070 RepID=A0A3S3PQR7_9ACAR|nr:MPN domain-containing protein-like protein [Dinothrombium tinctorium]